MGRGNDYCQGFNMAEAHMFEEKNEGQWPCGGLGKVVRKEWRSRYNG